MIGACLADIFSNWKLLFNKEVNVENDGVGKSMQYQSFHCEGGSLWQTEAERIHNGWTAYQTHQKKNIIELPVTSATKSIRVSIQVSVQNGGEQAGLYLYKDDGTWIKIVKEMTYAGVSIVMAKQKDYVPEVVGKAVYKETDGGKSLIFLEVMLGAELTVSFYEDSSAPKTVCRKEMPDQVASIRLADVFGEAKPRYLLMTEQWERDEGVQFGYELSE
jgi:hypothetical protein